jgi:hypothetical protein
MDEYSAVDGSLTTYDLVSGVVGLRAECLPGPGCNDQTTGVRFGLIVQSANRERDPVDQQEVAPHNPKVDGSIDFWIDDSDPMPITVEDRHYRYRVFSTVVPLKNIVWNPNP